MKTNAAKTFGVGQTGLFALVRRTALYSLQALLRRAPLHLADMVAERIRLHFQVAAYVYENIRAFGSPQVSFFSAVGCRPSTVMCSGNCW